MAPQLPMAVTTLLSACLQGAHITIKSALCKQVYKKRKPHVSAKNGKMLLENCCLAAKGPLMLWSPLPQGRHEDSIIVSAPKAYASVSDGSIQNQAPQVPKSQEGQFLRTPPKL